MRARATLTIAGERALGWLTDRQPDAPAEVALILDSNLSMPFRPCDLSPHHFIELHGSREIVGRVLPAAGEAGSTVGWPANDPLPKASRN